MTISQTSCWGGREYTKDVEFYFPTSSLSIGLENNKYTNYFILFILQMWDSLHAKLSTLVEKRDGPEVGEH